MRAVTYFDGATLREGTLSSDAGELALHAEAAPTGTPQLDGVITGLFTDHHVHLQLVDPAPLATSRLGRVIDLGGNPAVLREAEARAHVAIEFAGAFFTAVGGYPSDRDWTPEGSVRQIGDADAAARAVQEMTDAGASWIKVVGNSDAGPVLDDELFGAVVRAAAAHGLPVVAHAEGAGQAQRVARLGASRLAHSPFTERLTDAEIAEQVASVSWISTMAIQVGDSYAHVVDNVRRFAAAGGELLYGSDMGNGPTPVDLRGTEIAALRAAGVDGVDLLRTLAPLDPVTPGADLLLLTNGDPVLSRRLSADDVKE